MKDFLIVLIVVVSIALITGWILRLFGASEYTVGMLSVVSAITFTRILFEE